MIGLKWSYGVGESVWLIKQSDKTIIIILLIKLILKYFNIRLALVTVLY